MSAGIAGKQVRRRKVGTYLMLAFMVGWIVSMMGIEFAMGVQKGFGTGFGDGGRVPSDIVARVGVGPKAADVVAATSLNAPPMSVTEQVFRIVFSFAVLLGIVAFWYVIVSRIGIF